MPITKIKEALEGIQVIYNFCRGDGKSTVESMARIFLLLTVIFCASTVLMTMQYFSMVEDSKSAIMQSISMQEKVVMLITEKEALKVEISSIKECPVIDSVVDSEPPYEKPVYKPHNQVPISRKRLSALLN